MLGINSSAWAFLPETLAYQSMMKCSIALTGLVIANWCCYKILDTLFEDNLEEYNSLLPHKKKYVVKNLTKSGFLTMVLVGCVPWLMDVIIDGVWHTSIISLMGTVYVATDLSGLLFVPRLPTPTKLHHTIVCFLGFLNAVSDYSQIGLHRALISLTYLSSIPYLVNTYLGLRYLQREKIQNKIVDLSLYLYFSSVVINFWIQHSYVFIWIPGFSWIKVVYIVFYYLILYDDIKLIRYLFYKYRSKNNMFAITSEVIE